MRKATYKDEIGSDEEKAGGAEGAPGEGAEQEGGGNAGEGETGYKNGRAEDEDDEVAEDRGAPRGRGRADQIKGLLKP